MDGRTDKIPSSRAPVGAKKITPYDTIYCMYITKEPNTFFLCLEASHHEHWAFVLLVLKCFNYGLNSRE